MCQKSDKSTSYLVIGCSCSPRTSKTHLVEADLGGGRWNFAGQHLVLLIPGEKLVLLLHHLLLLSTSGARPGGSVGGGHTCITT